jgi:uncharacterized membrane protein YccC
MSATGANIPATTLRGRIVDSLNEETGIWLFVFKTLAAFYVAGWLAMRLSLPQPSTAMMTTIIVANRQSGMVLAKSFYRGIGTLAGAAAAFLIVGLFPQDRTLFLAALSVWIGACAGGATLYRNFTAYAFVLSGYTAALIAFPVINHPAAVFDSAVARISEVLLGLLVSGVVSDAVFPTRMRDVLRRTAREQFANFVGFVRASSNGKIAREALEKAHLRFVRDAVAFEDLRSSVIFEDPEARARSGHLLQFNQAFMAASTTFQSLHHRVNRLRQGGHDAPAGALLELFTSIGTALDAPIQAGAAARTLLPRLEAARHTMTERVPTLRSRLVSDTDLRDFDAGAYVLRHFAGELHALVDTAASLQAPKLVFGSAERVRFTRGNDFLGAGLAMFRTTLTLLALGAFWIASAWPMGSSAIAIATAFAGLFAAAPNPTAIVYTVLIGYAAGLSAGFICVFFVLTHMDGYLLLVVGSAPFLMAGLAMMARPSAAGIGMGYSIAFAFILSLTNRMVFDPTQFINQSIAQIVGIAAAAIAFIGVPSAIGSRWLRRRQLERLRRQVVLAAQAPLAGLLARFESVNHDLFNQIVAQTPPASDDSRDLVAWTLAVHETGRALIHLRFDMAGGALPTEVGHPVTLAIGALAELYEHPDAAGYLRARDALAAAIVAVGDYPMAGPLLAHLHLIRQTLLDGDSPLAPFFPAEPTPGEPDDAS